MTLAQMRYFAAVCRHENYTRAAEELFISQSALSQAIRQIETECRLPLVVRHGNLIRITDAGRILLSEISPILQQADNLESQLRENGLTRNYLRVGLSSFSGNVVFPSVCAAFQAQYPGVRISCHESTTMQLLEMLDAGTVDVVISAPIPAAVRDYSKKYGDCVLASSGIRFCVGAGTPYAQLSYITAAEIAKIPLVLMSENYTLTKHIMSYFKAAGCTPNVMLMTSQMYTVLRFVESGAAGGFMPAQVTQNNRNVVCIPYDDENNKDTRLLWRRDKMPYPVIQDFITFAKQWKKRQA